MNEDVIRDYVSTPDHKFENVRIDLLNFLIFKSISIQILKCFKHGLFLNIVFVEVPEPGTTVSKDDEVVVIESVKAASDIYSPVSGSVVAINELLDDEPEKVNQDPYGDGWFFKVEPADVGELEEMLDADAYTEVCEEEDH